MISHSQIYRARAALATHYYADQADDYYSRDGSAATWQGEGARRLGAVGVIDPARFKAMLQGDFGHGITASQSVRKDAKARAALDLTFGAPKSITLQALIGGDDRLIKANDDAVSTALAYVEKHLAMGRRKEGGKSRVEHTGNLVVAKFRHETARPTEGAAPDPHLHVHALLMNLTQRADGQWVALSNEQIFQLLRVTDSIYQATLERNVRALGYAVRHEKNHIELAHISRQQIEFFSKRSTGITAELSARGTSRDQAPHALRQGINLAHRQAKAQDMSRTELHQTWKEAAIQAQVEAGTLIREAPHYRSTQDTQAAPMTREGWAAEVVRLGGSSHESALQLVDQAIAQGRLLMESPRYATRQSHEAESRILVAEQTGRGTWLAALPAQAIETGLDSHLTAGQREAVMLITTDADQISGIQGLAGTGKSFALQNAQTVLQQHNRTLVALAPYGNMVRNLRNDGVQANTVASVLAARDKRSLILTLTGG